MPAFFPTKTPTFSASILAGLLLVWLLTGAVRAQSPAEAATPLSPELIFKELKSKVLVFAQDSLVGKRRAANHRFVQDLGRLIKSGKSWNLPWNELAPVSVLLSPDGKWRIMTWSVVLEQNARRNYGCLFNQKGILFPLIDQQANQFENEESYSNKQWPGAVYYSLLPLQGNYRGLSCFAVLGLDAREPFSQRKVVDWICPDMQGEVATVGAPLISYKGQKLCRFQLNYPRDVQAQLFWDKDLSALVFDHLIPRGGDPASAHFDFIPDGSFDGLVWKDGLLHFQEMADYQPAK